MNTMPLNELFPITKRDISFLDFQYAGGKVGLMTVINVPYDSLDAVLNPASTLNTSERARRLGTLLVQLHTLVLMPSYFTEVHEEFDFHNPYSAEMFGSFSNHKLLNGITRNIKAAYLSAKDERDAGKPSSITILATNTQVPGRGDDEAGALVMNLLVTEESYEPNVAFHLRMFAASTARLEESGLTDGEAISLTNMRTFSEPANTMDMSPLHSTDFREYESAVDPEGTDIDPDAFKDYTDFIEAVKELPEDASPLDVIDTVFGIGSDEHRGFVIATLEGIVESLVKGEDAPPDIVMGITERFILNEWEELPASIKEPHHTFVHQMLGLPETYKYTYQLNILQDERTIFLFSPHANSLTISLNHSEGDTLMFEAGTYLAFGSEGADFLTVKPDQMSSVSKENLVLPVSDLMGIRNVTEEFTDTLRQSLVLSFVAAKLEAEGRL